MVAPMEDSMEALLDMLLRPLLPRKMFPNPKPSISQQQAVAKQMHAIVIMYNYYYRKQCPQLKFLSFESICKAAIIGNEPLVAYLDKTRSTTNNPSLVEEFIIQACDISLALSDHDQSKIAVWPIETVAVFLADAKRENCFLKKDTLVKGVFSLVEKEVEGQTAEDVHEQIALSEVESATGMQISVSMVRSAYQLVLSVAVLAIQNFSGETLVRYFDGSGHKQYRSGISAKVFVRYIVSMKALKTLKTK